MAISGEDILHETESPDTYDDIDEMPDKSSDAPFDKGFELLSVTDGEKLDIMTRMTPEISRAGSIALAYEQRFPHMKFIPALYSQIKRHAVAIRGEGRKEIATTVQAFSGAQASYYDADAEKSKSEDKSSFIPIGRGNDNDGA